MAAVSCIRRASGPQTVESRLLVHLGEVSRTTHSVRVAGQVISVWLAVQVGQIGEPRRETWRGARPLAAGDRSQESMLVAPSVLTAR